MEYQWLFVVQKKKKSKTVSYPPRICRALPWQQNLPPGSTREAMNKRWCSKDNRIEEVVSILLIPEICCYFVKCKIKILGKGTVH